MIYILFTVLQVSGNFYSNFHDQYSTLASCMEVTQEIRVEFMRKQLSHALYPESADFIVDCLEVPAK